MECYKWINYNETHFSWIDAHNSLTTVILSNNDFTTFSWKDAHNSLITVDLYNNKFTTFSWNHIVFKI